MPQISINKELLTQEINNNSTINDLINMILDNADNQEKVITEVYINGKVLNMEEENKSLPTTIGQYEDINFTLQSGVDLAFEALESCNSYIDVVVSKIHEMIELYQANEHDHANQCFAEVIEIMDLYVQLITKIYKTIGRAYKGLEKDQSVKKLEIHLLSVLKALIPAKEKEDIIMLCDLLEYELVDNLTQWKIKVIPELKRLRDN
jgi:hypothetical protein